MLREASATESKQALLQALPLLLAAAAAAAASACTLAASLETPDRYESFFLLSDGEDHEEEGDLGVVAALVAHQVSRSAG